MADHQVIDQLETLRALRRQLSTLAIALFGFLPLIVAISIFFGWLSQKGLEIDPRAKTFYLFFAASLYGLTIFLRSIRPTARDLSKLIKHLEEKKEYEIIS